MLAPDFVGCNHLSRRDLLEIASLLFDKDEMITEEGFYRAETLDLSGPIDENNETQLNIIEILLRELTLQIKTVLGVLVIPSAGKLINIYGIEVRFPFFILITG